MTDGGLRIATADGAMLADPKCLGNVADERIFDPHYWAGRGQLLAVPRGRGAAWFIAGAPRPWVLRHYRRGGFIARLSEDAYVWAGEERVRAFREWRLLYALRKRGLPVPEPVAALYRRRGLCYRCDLITERIVGASPLSEKLVAGVVPEANWHMIGSIIARLHAAGADHADLNAHNILIDEAGAVSVIDFDRGRLRAAPAAAGGARTGDAAAGGAGAGGARAGAAGGARAGAAGAAGGAGSGAAPAAWAAANLARLRRSLEKVSRGLPDDRFCARQWDYLLAGYAAP
jgi:3-deoxy-D-manno-octulosonic acid kinase